MKKLLFGLLALCLFVPVLGSADGGIVSPEEYYMYETGQKGVIFYESDTSTETMVVSMTFEGNAKDFAWIIPTPNKPEVVKGSQDLFTELEELTGYDYMYETESSGFGLKDAVTAEDAVTVVEEKTVDYYDIAVLASTDADALSTWLNDNGFKYPEKYAYILNDYIDNDWYFVAAKIIPELAKDSDVEYELNSGTATPLQLTFEAENLVFPLKISQISEKNIAEATDSFSTYSNYMDIYLYVITDHKQELTNFTVDYADSIKGKEIENLATDTNGNAWVSPKDNNYYLTKLYGYYYTGDMDEDLFPKDAEDNDDVTQDDYYTWTEDNTLDLVMYSLIFTVIGIIISIVSPCLLFFLIFTIIYYFAKSHKVKVTFVVLQIIDTVITSCLFTLGVILTVFAFIYMFEQAGYYAYYYDDEIMLTAAALASSVTLLFLICVKVIALIVQKIKYKKGKKK
ncbi:MAG: DUF2330 domain-containing protein [Patescibacteria group bacterium]